MESWIPKLASILLAVFVAMSVEAAKKKDERDCEVCIKSIEKFKKDLPDSLYNNENKLEAAFKKFCMKLPRGGKENRFCYFVGGTEDAATGILSNVIKPLGYHMPANKICQKLKNMDPQICELRYDVKPDFSKLSKMRVGELKKILSNWGEDMACKGCAEKADYVSKVKELLKKHEPEDYKKLYGDKTEL